MSPKAPSEAAPGVPLVEQDDVTSIEEFRTLLAANDARIREETLDNGREIAAERTSIYTDSVARWAARQHAQMGYDRPFAVVALGGTGRGELTPCSDLDFAFLFDDRIEGNSFLLELQRQTLHSGEFERAHGFGIAALPFNLDDVVAMDGKQLNSFLDMRPIHDPGMLSQRFRSRIAETNDPFEHFLHVHGFWKNQWEKASGECERLDRFDIKNDGLRVFLAGVWTLASKTFVHSHEIYRTMEDPRDLAAYGFLLRIRSFVHSRRSKHGKATLGGNHPEDVLTFDDFQSFGELLGPGVDEQVKFEFASQVRSRLLSARRRVAQFTNGVIGRELARGRERRPGSPVIYGVGGLRLRAHHFVKTSVEQSRMALSLLLSSQRYGVPIDQAELEGLFRNAGDWLTPVPELSALFYEPHGSLAGSFDFLSRVDGAEDRLFPGYARFEGSLDDRVLTERRALRSALERDKMRALESLVREGQSILSEQGAHGGKLDPFRVMSVGVEAALLDPDHLAAVKLALKTKRLPLTLEDEQLRADVSKPLHERFSTGFSGIPLSQYYRQCFAGCEFSPVTLEVAQFLVAQRRAFKLHAAAALNDPERVRELLALCQTESRLRALFVFTCADRAFWESEADDPARWRNTRELYWKTLRQFYPDRAPTNTLSASGYTREEMEILKDFGEDFFSGLYGTHANRFGAHLLRLAQDPEFSAPKAAILREGASTILGIATRDFRGLAACISGALWRLGVPLRQAHLFSAAKHGLALDFFHLARMNKVLGAPELRGIEDAIQRRMHIGEQPEMAVASGAESLDLSEIRPGLYSLQAETSGEIGSFIYLLTFAVFRHLGGNVFGLAAHAAKGGEGRSKVMVYHSLPPNLDLPAARAILRQTIEAR